MKEKRMIRLIIEEISMDEKRSWLSPQRGGFVREIYRTAGVEMNREDLQEMGRAIYKIWEEANVR